MPKPEVSFEEVFGFRPPSPEEVSEIIQEISLKTNNNGLPIGTMALFSIPELRDVSMEIIGSSAERSSEEEDIDQETASMLIYVGFINAIELLTAIKLKISD